MLDNKWMHDCTRDGVVSNWFSGNIKEPISSLEHEVATRTGGTKNVKGGTGWETPEYKWKSKEIGRDAGIEDTSVKVEKLTIGKRLLNGRQQVKSGKMKM
jgi:hypothetical protein